MLRANQLLVCTLSLMVAGLFGCGPASNGPTLPTGPKATVKGKVTHEGKPVTSGNLALDSGKGFALGAKINADGTFELIGQDGKDVPAGKYKVAVSPPTAAPAQFTGPDAKMPEAPKIEGVPAKFYETSTSGVEIEIGAGAQDITIDLK